MQQQQRAVEVDGLRACFGTLQGAKLFYLSGMVYSEYQTQEVKNLGRFISVMKFRPLVWQTSHPYVLADRWGGVDWKKLK